MAAGAAARDKLLPTYTTNARASPLGYSPLDVIPALRLISLAQLAQLDRICNLLLTKSWRKPRYTKGFKGAHLARIRHSKWNGRLLFGIPKAES